MEEQGLAAQSQGQGGGQMDQAKMMELVQQVARLLAQGVSPQELMQKGVPEEVIQMAMQMVQEQQEPQMAPQVPNSVQGQGLAAEAMQR